MKTTHHISPLTLFIMTQALGDVKQAPPSVVLESEPDSNVISSSVLEPLMESKSFQDIQWEKLYQQALLCGVPSITCHPSLFNEQKTSLGALFIPCQEVMDWAQQATNKPQAVIVDCSLSHAPSCFQAIHALKEKSLDVWVSGHPCAKGSAFDSASLFSDDNLQKSSQLGFSWYFQSSDMEKINLLFEHSLPAWRFWFKHDQSRQWIWPFCDIIYYRLCEDYKTSPATKPWIKDQRQRNSWAKLEERVYNHFLAIMGGEVVVSSFMRKALSLKKGQ